MANQSQPVIADLIGVTQVKDKMPHLGAFTTDPKGSLTPSGIPIDIGTATNIYTGFFCDTGYINLMVKTSQGLARFYSLNLDNTLTPIGTDAISIPWEHQVYTGKFRQTSPYTDIAVIDQGEVQFYASDGKGGLTPLTSNAKVPVDCILKPGRFDLRSDLTDFCIVNDGSLQFFSTDGEGNLIALGKKQTCWELADLIVGNFGDETEGDDLLLVNRETWEAQFYTLTGEAEISPIGDIFDGSGFNDASLIAGPFVGGQIYDSIMACDESGGIRFFSTDGKGGMEQVGDKITQYQVAAFTPIKIVR